MHEFDIVIAFIEGLTIIAGVFVSVIYLTRSITKWSDDMQQSIEHLTMSVNRLDRTLKESVAPKLEDLHVRVEELERLTKTANGQ